MRSDPRIAKGVYDVKKKTKNVTIKAKAAMKKWKGGVVETSLNTTFPESKSVVRRPRGVPPEDLGEEDFNG